MPAKTDMRLPGKSGNLIKAVHIIAQTAYGIEGDRAKAIEGPMQ